MPVLRNMAQAAHIARADMRMGDILPFQQNMSAVRLVQACQGIYKLCLAVAIYARHAHNLAAAHLKAHMVHHVFSSALRVHTDVLCLQHHVCRLRGALFHHKVHLTAHHHFAHFLFRRRGHVYRADTPALAKNRAAVCHRLYLIQLMRDEQDALALFHKLLHNLH